MRSGELVAERFEIAAEAGSGGMSIVYRARDRHTGALVALKVLQGAEPMAARFARESRVLAELSHPGIVRYVAHGATASGQRYLAMEWLDGEDLAERLLHGGLTARESITLCTRVAEGLGFAHARGIVHRDVKPSNLFLPERQVERVKILDFGIARQQQPSDSFDMTMTGTRLGTPAYMSPEQARGLGELDARVDVFALGCVLYECLSGTKAFSGEDAMALTAKILLEEPPKLRELGCDVPAELEALVAEMLAKEPAARPADGNEVARRLAALPMDILPDARPSLVPSAGALGGGERRLLAVVMARGAHGDSDELKKIVAAHGGHFERIADGSIVVTLAGSGAATDLVAQAARCALAMRAALWGGLVALATGRGLLSARLPLGEVIERAVRLVRAGLRADATLVSEKGDSGERAPTDAPPSATNAVAVRLDETSAGLLDARFDVGGDSEGLALRAERTMVEAARTLLGKPTPCVGREAELGSLGALFAASVDEPQARAVLVTAPAGVGKSRLRYEFMRQLGARPEPLELWMGRCDPMSAGAPFALLADVIRRVTGLFEGEPLGVRQKKIRARLARVVPEIDLPRLAAFIGELVGTPFPDDDDLPLRAARHDPTLMGDQMRRAWEDWLAFECCAQPVVLVLEDLHWGDLPTVRFIDAALRNLRDRPLFVLALARPDVHEQFPRLWAERDFSEIRLGELSRKAAERLARQVLGAGVDAAELGRIVERAAGNAFYLEELIRAAAEGKGEEPPETVLAMVQARLERMEPAARHVLRAASLFGQVFWRGGVLALLGDSTEATQLDGWLSHLVEREVLSPRSDRRFPDEKEYGFRHALVRE
ncbi:MAG TPA: protein kinase, partial [Polyangia bacterium]